jgi:glycosyltransferase involved in cell wall biosynthesis
MPAVSVMMVCYNAAPTLPWALGSLLAQTSNDWECIFVDDGSTDRSFDIVVGLGDPRIRAFRFDTNRGRGAARQFALEQAEGDYLCFLDADDWMYPWRVQTELDFLEAEPKVALVSSGWGIQDSDGNLAGIRGDVNGDKPQVFSPFTRLRMPPFPFPPSMIRMRTAKLYKFDPRLRAAEDAAFLIQILSDHSYGILHQSLYAYSEHLSVTLERMITDYNFVREIFRNYRAEFPLQSRIKNLEYLAKGLAYRTAFALKRSEWLVGRRWRIPTPAEVAESQAARKRVAMVVKETFGTPVVGAARCHSL